MENSKKIIIYYSYTGNTRMIAKKIQKKLNCDILELKPVVPYSDDYQAVVDKEQTQEAIDHQCKIQDIGIDLSKYNEIILGFPTWWYIPASLIRTFSKENDLSGKVIVPFATNAGWLGKSFKEVSRLCPNSKVENEMDIVFESYSDKLKTDEKEIDNWIDNIGKEN